MPVQFPKKVYVNSDNRTGGTSNDFTYECRLDPNIPYDRVCVLNAAIPKSFYVVQSNYNTFVLIELGVDTVVSITPGNYGATTFATELRTRLNASSPNGWSYSVSYSSTAGKYTFGVSGNSGQPGFRFYSPSSSNIHENMGFEPSSTNTFSASTLTSDNVIKMISENTIYIHTNAAASDDNDILQEVYTSQNSDMSVIVYTQDNIEANSKKLMGGNTRIFRIYFTNEAGNTIDFNGLNTQLVLLFYVDRFGREDAYYEYSVLTKEQKRAMQTHPTVPPPPPESLSQESSSQPAPS